MSVLKDDSACGSRETLTLKDTGKISVWSKNLSSRKWKSFKDGSNWKERGIT